MPVQPSRRVFAALALLTFVTGVVDAASILGLGHVFTANMTGNVVFLGFALAGEGQAWGLASIWALGSFLLGATIGGALALRVGSLRRALGVVALLLTVAAALGWIRRDVDTPDAALIVLLATSMGFQNATVRRLGVADMSTTVVTLTLAGLAADSPLAGGRNPHIGRRVLSLVAMLAGAAFGAWLFRHALRWTLVAAAAAATGAFLLSEDAPRSADAVR
jgi:uncharacterized membrane protein YoaK (UPF0700 family)